MLYINLTLLAAIVVYVVDLSGFTTSWRTALASFLHKSETQLKALPPFDCSKCAVWWGCLIFTLCSGHISLFGIAFCALLSLLSIPMGQLMIFIREGLTQLVNFLQGLTFKR